MKKSKIQSKFTNQWSLTPLIFELALIDQLLDAWADTGGLAETMVQRITANDDDWSVVA